MSWSRASWTYKQTESTNTRISLKLKLVFIISNEKRMYNLKLILINLGPRLTLHAAASVHYDDKLRLLDNKAD